MSQMKKIHVQYFNYNFHNNIIWKYYSSGKNKKTEVVFVFWDFASFNQLQIYSDKNISRLNSQVHVHKSFIGRGTYDGKSSSIRA